MRRLFTQDHVSMVLNAVAGWVDSMGYLSLLASLRMFPSFMSGNLTKIVTDAVTGDFSSARGIAGAVSAFFAGVIIARLVNGGAESRDPISLAMVAFTLGVSALNLRLGGSEYLTLVLLALGMGMINRAFSGHMAYQVRPFLSGVWVQLGSTLADVIVGRASLSEAVGPTVTVGTVLIGAMSGAVAITYANTTFAIAVPASVVTLIVLVLLAGLVEPRDREDGT